MSCQGGNGIHLGNEKFYADTNLYWTPKPRGSSLPHATGANSTTLSVATH